MVVGRDWEKMATLVDGIVGSSISFRTLVLTCRNVTRPLCNAQAVNGPRFPGEDQVLARCFANDSDAIDAVD